MAGLTAEPSTKPPAKRAIHRSLRVKLLLASLSLLAIPWAGYYYLNGIETLLRQAQEQGLLSRAELAARLLDSESISQLMRSSRGEEPADTANVLYAHQLDEDVLLDGYLDDWASLWDQRRQFRASESDPAALAFDLLLGLRGGALYLAVQVRDASRHYTRTDSEPLSGDHLLLALPGAEGRPWHYAIGTPAPGWVSALPLEGAPPRPEIRGEWQERAGGYTVELRLPLMQDPSLSLAVADVASGQSGVAAQAATSGLQRNASLSRVLLPSAAIDRQLAQLTPAGSRTLLLDRHRQVLGQAGSLSSSEPNAPESLLSDLYGLLLGESTDTWISRRERLGRLDGPEIRAALQGRAATYRRQDERQGPALLSSAQPILHEGQVIGAILLEQTTERILSLQQQAAGQLALISLLLFLLTGATLFAFATSLTGRIIRLSRRVSQAATGDGRLTHPLAVEPAEDEVGDLERSFLTVLERLRGYNHYLEAMASRLAHEFRTPLSMIRSSLENLGLEPPSTTHSDYLARAFAGVERLSGLLNRMSEASRLEQSLQGLEKELLELGPFLQSVAENAGLSYPGVAFVHAQPVSPLQVRAAPELLYQALEKILANAVDFHQPGTPIELAAESNLAGYVCIRIRNQGPGLPNDRADRLFDSLYSVRAHKDSQPHLGLGLYLVRLIAQAHAGKVTAENIPDGVQISICLPGAD